MPQLYRGSGQGGDGACRDHRERDRQHQDGGCAPFVTAVAPICLGQWERT